MTTFAHHSSFKLFYSHSLSLAYMIAKLNQRIKENGMLRKKPCLPGTQLKGRMSELANTGEFKKCVRTGG